MESTTKCEREEFDHADDDHDDDEIEDNMFWNALSKTKAIKISKCNFILCVTLFILLALFMVLYFFHFIYFGSSLITSPFNKLDHNICSYDNDNIFYSKQDANNSLKLMYKNEEILFNVLDVDDDNVLSFDEFKIYLSISRGISNQFDALNTLFASSNYENSSNKISISEMVYFAMCSCNDFDADNVDDISSRSPLNAYFCTAFKQIENELCELISITGSNEINGIECYEMVSYYLLYRIIADDAIYNEYMTKQQYIDAKSVDIYNQLGLDENNEITLDEFKSLRNNSYLFNDEQINLMQQTMNNYNSNKHNTSSTNCNYTNYELESNEILINKKYSKQEIKQFIELYMNKTIKTGSGRNLISTECTAFNVAKCTFDALMCMFTCAAAVAEPTPFGEFQCIECAGSYIVGCGEVVYDCWWEMNVYYAGCDDRMQQCMYDVGYSNGFECQQCIDLAAYTDYWYCTEACLCNVDEMLCN